MLFFHHLESNGINKDKVCAECWQPPTVPLILGSQGDGPESMKRLAGALGDGSTASKRVQRSNFNAISEPNHTRDSFASEEIHSRSEGGCVVDEEDQERCRTGAVVPKRVCEWKEGVVKREPLMFHEFRRQKCAFDWLDAQRRSAQEKNLQGCSAGDEIKAAAKKIAPHNWEACAENIRKCYKLNGVVESRDALQSNTSQMGHGASSYCHMMPFSMELKGRDGAWFRRYAAATYSSILSKCKQHARCYFYEVIRDGYPCHMYFDLEYNVEENPSLDGNRMVDSLLLKLDNFLKGRLQLALSDSCIIELDSSSSLKFSRHIIVRFENCAFKDSFHLKNFVHAFMMSSNTREFVVAARNANGLTRTSFVDQAVYSKNRVFRTIWSCKGGQDRKFIETDRYSLSPPRGPVDRDRIFELSLICNVQPDASMLEFDDASYNQECIRDLLAGHPLRENPPATGDAQLNRSTASTGASRPESREIRHGGRGITIKRMPNSLSSETLVRKAIETIGRIESIGRARAGNREVRVNSICICGKEDEIVSYGLLGPGSFFCENIAGDHKSNHVYLIANISCNYCYQKCWDPDCIGFASRQQDL